MNTVERVISLCKERKIPVSRLEKECSMSNGYIKNLKKGSIPDDKLKKISEYLNLDLEYLATGKEKDVPSFSPEHIELISAYDKLSNANKLAIMQIIKSLSTK